MFLLRNERNYYRNICKYLSYLEHRRERSQLMFKVRIKNLYLHFCQILPMSRTPLFLFSEPAVLVMYYSMRSHPAITATLLDFLCRVCKQNIWAGLFKASLA